MTFSHVLQFVMLLLGYILLWNDAPEDAFSLKQKVGLALLFMAGYSIVSDFLRHICL
jgi:hypothetical protein